MCGGGNRPDGGAGSQEIVALVLRTSPWRGLDATEVLTTPLSTGRPTVL
jgi:hypothetical protein